MVGEGGAAADPPASPTGRPRWVPGVVGKDPLSPSPPTHPTLYPYPVVTDTNNKSRTAVMSLC